MVLQMTNVFDAASGKIIDYKDFIAALQIGIGKMRADEAGATGYEYPQVSVSSTTTVV